MTGECLTDKNEARIREVNQDGNAKNVLRVAKELTTYTLLVTGDDCPLYCSGLGGCVKGGTRDDPTAAAAILLAVNGIKE